MRWLCRGQGGTDLKLLQAAQNTELVPNAGYVSHDDQELLGGRQLAPVSLEGLQQRQLILLGCNLYRTEIHIQSSFPMLVQSFAC